MSSNWIVGYSVGSRMKSRLAAAAINNAVGMRRGAGETVAGCIVQSDRGSLVTWIERIYHRRRRQDALGRVTRSNSS